MSNIYSRNRLYISSHEQYKIKECKIFIAGCGIGSVIAECALRLGFEHMAIADGDLVESTNLNRQNYTSYGVNQLKVAMLKERLLSINPDANITSHDHYLDNSTIELLLEDCKIAINALDFTSDTPFIFDAICGRRQIPVLHPYNIGWGSLIFVIMPGGEDLTKLSKDHTSFEKKVAEYLISHLSGNSKSWVAKILHDYNEQGDAEPPPQLSIASWLAAGACTSILYRLATGKSIKQFPEYYFITPGEH